MSSTKISKPDVQAFALAGRDGDTLEFIGVKLGYNTSYQDAHTHHPRRSAAKREKCSACRWFEVAIYRRYVEVETAVGDMLGTTGADYVVHTVGATSVAGEQRFSRISVTESAFEVIEFLTVRKIDEEPFITVQSSRALAQASARDKDIRDAYINRAVV